MFHSHRSPVLARAQLAELRPTQLTAGFAEVKLKARQWAGMSKKQRKAMLQNHVFPSVLGPGKDHYIVDHHHLGIALLNEGIDDVFITVLDDMSWLSPAVFWRTMEFRSWSHPYDHRGKRRDYRDMPRRLAELKDDPYRSLAGLVRDAGGFAKNEAPFVEFLWADYFRPLFRERTIKKDPRTAVGKAVRLARAGEARYLPGWSGKSP